MRRSFGILLAALGLLVPPTIVASGPPEQVALASPDGTLRAEITVSEGQGLRWGLSRDGVPVVEPAELGISIDKMDLGSNATLLAFERGVVNEHYAFRGGKALATNQANTLTLRLRSGSVEWRLEARCFDDGFAFRYVVPGRGPRTVNGEASSFRLPEGARVWFAERNNAWKLKSYAGYWTNAPIAAMPSVSKMGPMQGPPLVAELSAGGFALLSEAADFNYSGLRLRAARRNTFQADFSEGAHGFELQEDIVTPWRAVVVARDLNALVNTTLINNLVPAPDPGLFADASYIRPGRSVWRWQLRGTGSVANQKEYADFAAQLGYEYSLVDEGWEKEWPSPMKDLAELCRYAALRKVGVFVWKRWGEVADPADDYSQLRSWLDAVKAAGVAGVKVDFFNGETLALRRGEERVLRESAKRRLMVDIHGCPEPTGEDRRYPNQLSREGIRGLELNFMSEGPLTPSHDAALPFTRCVVGPADFTPLTFSAAHLGATTVAHQLACAVTIVSPLLVFTAFPEEMLHHPEPQVTTFLKAVPSVWDETRVLPCSKIGDLAVLARRHGESWFVAGVNGGPARRLTIDTAFLPPGRHTAILLGDGPKPTDVRARKVSVTAGADLEVEMAAGGGFVLWLRP